MANPFDQFDPVTTNPFDQFDVVQSAAATPKQSLMGQNIVEFGMGSPLQAAGFPGFMAQRVAPVAQQIKARADIGKQLIKPLGPIGYLAPQVAPLVKELSNWPQPNPAINKQLSESAMNLGLTAGPITPMSGTMRGLLQPTATAAPGTFQRFLQRSLLGYKAPPSQLQETLKAAQEVGYVVPPSEVKPDSLTGAMLESTSGKAGTRQGASQINAAITNKLIREDLNIPEGTPLTLKTLANMRKEQGQAYEVAKNIGTLTADKPYHQALKNIAEDYAGASQDFPELVKPEVEKLVNGLDKPTMSSQGVVKQVSNLRSTASELFAKQEYGLGYAYREAADALDDLLERNMEPALGQEVMQNYRNARVQIAKIHNAEDALNSVTGNISTSYFGKLAAKNKYLTGGMKTAGEFAEAFPHAVKKPEMAGSPNISKLQATASAILGTAGGLATLPKGEETSDYPGWGVAAAILPFVAPMAARSIMFSPAYQRALLQKVPQATTNPVLGRALAAYLQNNQKQEPQ